MTGAKFNEMINKKSGLLGISETSSDVRDLLKCQKNDPRAAEALAIFCYQARKWIGAFTAALGGLDTLVFSGGIGENSIPIRARICEGLGYLVVKIDLTDRQIVCGPPIRINSVEQVASESFRPSLFHILTLSSPDANQATSGLSAPSAILRRCESRAPSQWSLVC